MIQDIGFTALVGAMFYHKNIYPSAFTYAIAVSYFVFDFYFMPLSLAYKMHHIATIWLFAYDYAYHIPHPLRSVLIETESSSIVLTALPYLPRRIKPFGKLLFLGLFAKTRLYAICQFLSKETTFINCAVWFLYILNVYWFIMICKKNIRKHFIEMKPLFFV